MCTGSKTLLKQGVALKNRDSILIGLAGPTALRFDWMKTTAVIFKFQQQQKPGKMEWSCVWIIK